jgi:hypothetical protein
VYIESSTRLWGPYISQLQIITEPRVHGSAQKHPPKDSIHIELLQIITGPRVHGSAQKHPPKDSIQIELLHPTS